MATISNSETHQSQYCTKCRQGYCPECGVPCGCEAELPAEYFEHAVALDGAMAELFRMHNDWRDGTEPGVPADSHEEFISQLTRALEHARAMVDLDPAPPGTLDVTRLDAFQVEWSDAPWDTCLYVRRPDGDWNVHGSDTNYVGRISDGTLMLCMEQVQRLAFKPSDPYASYVASHVTLPNGTQWTP